MLPCTIHTLVIVASIQGEPNRTSCFQYPDFEAGDAAFRTYAPHALRAYLQAPNGRTIARGDNNCIR